MSVPPLPSPLEHHAGRPFSFYPAILNIEHNEWLFQRVTWSEILVVNTKTHLEMWIPRHFLGEVSRIDEPVMIVGLLKELEYKAGKVWPHERRVLELPRAVNEGLRPFIPEPGPGPVSPAASRPTGASTESRIGRLIGTAILGGLAICVVVVMVVSTGPLRSRVVFTAKDQAFVELTRYDDYYSIVRKLGPPAEDHWRSETGELQYQLLWYPQRSYFIVLLGTDRKSAHYVGAMDRNWHVIHYVELTNGGSTAALLRGLPKF
jgi:hypothetical protein